jgi:hypothetical protein
MMSAPTRSPKSLVFHDARQVAREVSSPHSRQESLKVPAESKPMGSDVPEKMNPICQDNRSV